MASPLIARSRGNTSFVERYGPWALVTGASDGIGREFAIHVAELRLNVVLVARRAERLNQLARQLRHDHGVEVVVRQTDLGNQPEVDQLIEATRDLDVGLVVAAAGFGTSGEFVETSRDDELAMIDVNVRAVAGLAHHFAPRLAARERDGLVLIGSLVGFQGVAPTCE